MPRPDAKRRPAWEPTDVQEPPGRRSATNSNTELSQSSGRRRFEYVVRYRRAKWQYTQQRIYQSRQAADRLVAKLRRGDWRYAQLVEVDVERREVGAWEAP
jgi:hypothetical protein